MSRDRNDQDQKVSGTKRPRPKSCVPKSGAQGFIFR